MKSTGPLLHEAISNRELYRDELSDRTILKFIAASTAAERLERDRAEQALWRSWGTYLSERQWGTVREDYSANGDVCVLGPVLNKCLTNGVSSASGCSSLRSRLRIGEEKQIGCVERLCS
jgi:hypothetical protein